MNNLGLGEYELARLLGQPLEIIEFHLWYLKAKDWVERLDTGQLAISAAGVDQVEQGKLSAPAGKFAHGACRQGVGQGKVAGAGPIRMPAWTSNTRVVCRPAL
ncbi:MAG: hypothetical protein GX147_09245 [Deltaproteobacteria bacterium]|nr:hypothetical protein [Deltaproteobacteria bacterium]